MVTCLVLPRDRDRLAADPAWRRANLLDLRPAGDFAAAHLAAAAPLPVEERLAASGGALAAKLAEVVPSIFLPPRHEPLAVVLRAPALAAQVAAALEARGRSAVTAVAMGPGAADGLPPGWLDRGPSRRALWRPPAFLERWAHLLPPPPAGPVLDAGCGSGRAAVWLAERGHRVTGVDRDPQALALARRLAASRSVAVDLVVADLREAAHRPPGPWAAVVCFRYLERDLLRALPSLLADDGVAVVRTFREAGGAGPPARRHRLAPGELRDLLPGPVFAHLVYEEDADPDGRPAAGIVARRISAGPPRAG